MEEFSDAGSIPASSTTGGFDKGAEDYSFKALSNIRAFALWGNPFLPLATCEEEARGDFLVCNEDVIDEDKNI